MNYQRDMACKALQAAWAYLQEPKQEPELTERAVSHIDAAVTAAGLAYQRKLIGEVLSHKISRRINNVREHIILEDAKW
jgi:hypothetical protein